MGSDLGGSRNDDAGHDTEEDLGESKPTPGDPGVERRIHESEDRVKKAGPKERSDYSAKKDRSPRPHWKHGSIEQPDQCANCSMDHCCRNQPVPMKGRDVSSCRVCPVCNACASKQIHCIPDTVLCQISVKESGEDHDDSPCYAATEPGDDGITLDREECSVNFADLDVRYPGSRAQWHKSSCRDRNHFMVLIGKDLPRPSPYAAADKNKARKADSFTLFILFT